MSAVYRLSSDDFTQLDQAAIVSQMMRWAQTWSAIEVGRVRFIFRATPVDLSEAIQHARRAESEKSDPHATQHIRQYIGLLQRAGQEDLFGFEHFLVLPTQDGDAADSTADALSAGMGVRAVRLTDLPPFLPTRYQTKASLLAPVAGAYPLVSVLVSYNLAGAWDWRVLSSVLTIGFPVDVAVEIITYHGPAAFGQLDRAQTMLHGLAAQLGAKTALTKMETDYNALLSAVQNGEAIHQIGLAILARGRTETELRERERIIEGKLTGRAHLRRLDGMQKEAFCAFFTAQAAPEAPARLRHNVTSSGVAVILGPLGLRRRGDTQGVLWGFSQQNPFFWDGFGAELKDPNHGVILGATGSGKTASVSGLAMREINLMGSQVIVMEPIGHCRRLVAAIGTERASYNPLSMQSLRINPIERLYDDMVEQSAHLAVTVQLLLGRPLSERELIALEAAAPLIYEGVSADTPSVNQPRLGDLAGALRSLSGERWVQTAGLELGGLVEELYVRGPRAAVFNVPTQSDWRMEHDLIAFDFSGLPEQEGLRRLGYYLVLSAIQREARQRARSRRRIVVVDEFRVMSAEVTLANQVATMYKTFRTLGVGVWAMEQDLQTFTGLSQAGVGAGDADRIAAGMYILSNATFVVALAHRPAAARLLPTFFPQLRDGHVQYLMSLNPQRDTDKGCGVIILPDAVYPIRIVLTQHELSYLGGS